jgi:hypothetical protein
MCPFLPIVFPGAFGHAQSGIIPLEEKINAVLGVDCFGGYRGLFAFEFFFALEGNSDRFGRLPRSVI